MESLSLLKLSGRFPTTADGLLICSAQLESAADAGWLIWLGRPTAEPGACAHHAVVTARIARPSLADDGGPCAVPKTVLMV
jgi:hypothetical protein